METAQIFAALNVIGLFVFAESGALTALRNDMDVFGVAMIAFVIGVGTIRDVLLNEPPLILKQDIYATAALIGAGSMSACWRWGSAKARRRSRPRWRLSPFAPRRLYSTSRRRNTPARAKASFNGLPAPPSPGAQQSRP
jgi:hypothetical protein